MIKIGILTAGGLAPCLSTAIGELILQYTKISPETEIIAYRNGYQGLLLGDRLSITTEIRQQAACLSRFGGSPIGNSRVKLTNIENCMARGFTKAGENPQKIAAEQLVKDGITVLHTIGGDDTNTAAADLADYLKKNHYQLRVIGLPKTIDNDVYPIAQSLGAATAAEAGAMFFEHIVSEATANPRMLIIHEIMGRNCGWLTAATALEYRRRLAQQKFLPAIGLKREQRDIHAVYIPEIPFIIHQELRRLRKIMDHLGNVNIFASEGACVSNIVTEMESKGQTIARDAFGHLRLDNVQTGQWIASRLSEGLGAEKSLVQKSGYFARASASNEEDKRIIREHAICAVEAAFQGNSGVIAYDEENGNKLSCIEFSRIRGSKPYNTQSSDFQAMLAEIGQI